MRDPSVLAGWVYFCVLVGVAITLWVVASNRGYQKGYDRGYIQGSKDQRGER